MKKYLLIILISFLAFTFQSDNPPGWYELTLPINDQVNDIYFTDSLNGWIVTLGDNDPPDTGYIMHTTDGGSSWNVQFSHVGDLNTIQFLDNNTGYAFGNEGFSRFYKTTNGGSNWQNLSGGVPIYFSSDMQFINKDTGWITSNITLLGGLAKTTNGGINWVQQLGATERPSKLFFINSDTGWALGSGNNLYRTINGGSSWNVQYNFPSGVFDLFMTSSDTGWVASGTTGIMKTSNSGYNWFSQSNPGAFGGAKFFFLNNTTGWLGSGLSRILATKDGETWGVQTTPVGNFYNVFFLDTNIGFAGGSKIIKTTDGGGPINGIAQISNEVPKDFKLLQNYPNPFNPTTNIKFKVKSSKDVKLIVFNITGKEISTLVNEKLSQGEYEYTFDGSNLTSGIYFYTLIADGVTVDTKKMLLIK